MVKVLLELDSDIWEQFKKSIPRDLKLIDAVSLLIIHHIGMADSGKVHLKVLMEKYGVVPKEIKAKFLVIKERL